MQGNELIPLLRGVSHQWAFWLALAAAAALVALSPAGTARLSALVYGAGLCLMLAASALYHRLKCSPRTRSLLCRIDHGAIYVFMAASYTPVALLVLEGATRWLVLGKRVGRRAGRRRAQRGLGHRAARAVRAQLRRRSAG